MTVEVIQFPAGIIPDVFDLVPDVGPGQSVEESPFIGAQTVATYRGAERWRLNMQLDHRVHAERGELTAFVARLRVSHNVFLARNFTAPQRGLLTGGSIQMLGVSSGSSLVIQSANTSSFWAYAGDFVSVNSALKMVLRDAATTAGGIGSLQVWPPMLSVNCGAAVFVSASSLFSAFRLTAPAGQRTESPGFRTSFSFTAVERVNSSHVSDFL